MGFTEEGQRDLMCIIVGVFNAAPGADNFSALAEPVLAGRSLRDLTADLVANPVFTQIYPAFATNTAFANEFLGNILGARGSIVDEALWDAAQGVVVGALNGGASRADIIYDVIQYLKSDDADGYNTGFQGASDMLNNKVDVALYHSVENELTSEGKNFDDLSAIVNDVDDTQGSVDAAIAEVDEEVNQGDDFFLTISQDEIVGTPVDDYIEGQQGAPDELSNPTTLQSGDTIDGGNGNDILRVSVSTTFDGESDEQAPDINNVEEIQVANRSEYQYDLDLQFAYGFNTITNDQPLDDVELWNMNELVPTFNLIGAENQDTYLGVGIKNAVANGDITINMYNSETDLYIWRNEGSDPVENVTIHSMGGVDNDLELGQSSNVDSYTIDGDTDLELYHETGGDSDTPLTVEAGMLNADFEFYSEGDDSDTTVNGAMGDNSIWTYDGDDTITTQDGDDFVNSGDGDDVIVAGGGDDVVTGEDGDDTIDGGAGDDTLYGEDGDDTITGGDGDDTIYIGDGTDTATGDAGDDVVYAYDDLTEDDDVDAGEGDADALVINNEVLEDATADDVGDEDEEDEAGTFESLVNNFEQIWLNGDLLDDIDMEDADGIQYLRLLHGVGNDTDDGLITITGLNSGATLTVEDDASDTSDTLAVSLDDAAGADDVLNLELSDSESTSDFGHLDLTGIEILNLNAVDEDGNPDDTDINVVADLVAPDLETINITGSASVDLWGPALMEVETVDASTHMHGIDINLDGNTNDVTITSADGTSNIWSGSGDDSITLGDGNHYVSGDDLGLGGGGGDDVITVGDADGDDSGSFIAGEDGDDTITVGDGEHYVDGGLDDDTITVGDTLDGDGGSIIHGEDGDDTITSGDGDDWLTGGDGDDTIDGGDGDNEFWGGEGLDTMTGGSDDDTYYYEAVSESQGVTVDVITNFAPGDDILDLSGVGGIAAADGDFYLGEANGYGAVLTSLSGDGDSEAVLDTSTSTVYIDVDGSGTLDDSDMAIQLNGVTAMDDDDFVYTLIP